MYKDVWKRFGTKILIVFCSVLLLGGVAIAAPRLRADTITQLDGEKIDLSTVGTPDGDGGVLKQPTNVSGAAIQKLDTSEYSGVERKITALTIKDTAGNIYPIQEGTDYTVSLEKGYDGITAKKQQVQIIATAQSRLLKPNSTCIIEYKITRALMPSSAQITAVNTSAKDGEYYKTITDTILISNDSETIGPDRINISVDGKELKKTEYKVVDVNGNDYVANLSSLQDLYIKYTNYYQGEDVEGKESWGALRLNIKKDIANASVTIDGEPAGSYTASAYEKPKKLSIQDGTTSINIASQSLELTADENYREIIIYPGGRLYGGRWRELYPVTKNTLELIPDDVAFDEARDYDESNHTYVFKPNKIRLLTDTTKTFESNEFEIVPGSEMIVAARGSDRVVPGATAGTVRLEVVLSKTGYVGQKGYLYYEVRRDISKANYEIEFYENDDYEYQDNKTHPVNMLVYFNGAPDYEESKKKDLCVKKGDGYTNYSMSYALSKWDMTGMDGNIDTYIPDNITDAGTVFITIVGGLGNSKDSIKSRTAGGYYGTLKGMDESGIPKQGLYYKIEKKDVVKAGYKITIKDSYLPFREPNVLEDGILWDKDGTIIQRLTALKSGVKVLFYESDGTTLVTDWSKASAGKKYWAVFSFNGNYKGDIKVQFDIQKYDPNDIDFELGACKEDGVGDLGHLYSGKEHRPNVINVTYQSRPLSEDEYRGKITYSNNENVGVASVTVTLAEGVSKTKTFNIISQKLNKGTLKLTEADGFKNGKHGYTGKTKYPQLTQLEFKAENNKEFVLKAGTDFDADSITLYDATTNLPVNDPSDLKLNQKYYFMVSALPSNPNFVNAQDPNVSSVKTEEFEISARSIGEENTEVITQIAAKTPYNSSDDEDVYLEYIKDNLVVRDDGFGTPGDTLTCNVDYTIERTDIDISNISENSTVKFTIHGSGCYTGYRTIILYVGQDITLSKLKEKSENEKDINRIDVGVGTSELVGKNYAQSGGQWNIEFVKNGAMDNNKIMLLYYKNNSNKAIVLSEDKEFSVHIDGPGASSGSGADSQYGKITITGKNGYYGVITISFVVKKINIAASNNKYKVELVYPDTPKTERYTYTGKPIRPELKVTDPTGTIVLTEGDDYVVDWVRNIKANTNSNDEPRNGDSSKAVAIVTGVYGYEGTIYGYFNIYRRQIYVEAEYTDDGTKEIYHAINDDYFRIDGWRAREEYTYTPYTNINGQEEKGVLPQLELYFGDETSPLKEGDNSDYKVTPLNNLNACERNVPKDKRPTMRFTASANSNFIGYFDAYFVIKPVTLTDESKCKVSLSPIRNAFSGDFIRPQVTVTLKRDGQPDYTLEKDREGIDYKVKYEGDKFVSVGQETAGNLATRAIVTEVTDSNDESKITGNLIGTYELPYTIFGEFNPNTPEAAAHSKMVISGGSIKYSPTSTKGGCNVVYYEKSKEQPDYSSTDKSKVRVYTLTEDLEYSVTVPNIIGVQEATVASKVDYFQGSGKCNITIVGDLGADYTECKGPGVISYSSSASDIKLQDKITVTCGGKTLVYGVDYKFDRTPTMTLGENEVRIIPFSDDIVYLEGSKLITYEVKAGVDDIILENVIDINSGSYTYAHGEEVIKEENVVVVIDGTRLTKDVDYTISIDDKVTVGVHNITIEGKGKYSGRRTVQFRIKPYNLADGYSKKEISVKYNSSVTYTGNTVFPEITSITAVAPSNSLVTLSPGDDTTRGDYELVEGVGNGDHINWTSGSEKPKFVISGVGNYEGEITLEYSITRKDISDADVTEIQIEDIPYQNGKDITPVPELKYAGRDLAGVLYSGNADDYINWADYTRHFSYEYSTKADLKSVGTKEIRVRGIGNFTGERVVTYNVVPLDIGEAELTFISQEAPVYDGTDLTPAFRLSYAGDVILEYTGSTWVSNYIKSAVVKFSNNRNATLTDLATVRVEIPEDVKDNYKGFKEVTFTIMPASLANHTKFMYHPAGQNGNVDLKNYKLNYPFNKGNSVMPNYAGAEDAAELKETQVGIYYDDPNKANNGAFLNNITDYEISYQYVEPDTNDVEVREEYRNPEPPLSYAGKVKVTITGVGNYTDSASFWYFIGKDISKDANFTMKPTTAIYNSQKQYPTLTVTGVKEGEYLIGRYKDEVALKNLIQEKDFVNAGTYYIRIEGDPTNGTYATEPMTLTYTITPRAFSNNLIIDGFKREYSYTGFDICPVGISVTDYIDNIKYRLTEDVDYTLTYTNNLNAGTAYINVEGKNNFSGKATANFMITSSTISSGGSWGSNSFLDQGTGEISGATSVAPSDVNLSMDTVDAMYYTGKAVYPKVSVPGMTENVDYTVTFSNNVEVGTAVATVTGIGNNNGTITKNFRIIAQLSKCTISPIPAQQYTGSEVKPALTVKCGNNILMEGTDYTATYSNNVNIGTATVTLRALNNANYTGTTTVKFSIANDVGGFIISGYAPSYAYTGNAITPGVVVETGSRTLVLGTEYTVSYSNNVNAGVAMITVTGIGRYSGTQTATFVIEPKSMQSLDTSDVADRTYTGDAYTPDITVSDGGKVLTKGVDYTVTYKNNTDPGMASIVIQGTNSNYTGTKVISFKISAVAVKGLKASSVKYNSLKLKWTKQGYADGYQICNSNSKVVKTVKANSATITGLSAGKTYKYKVRSYVNNTDGTKSYGAFSSVLSTTTKLKTPTVKVVSKAKGQARISWSKVTGASGYEIYYKKSSKEKYKKLKTVNNPNIRVCTVRGMKSGDRAYFRIRAFRKNGSKKVYSSLNPLKVITVK